MTILFIFLILLFSSILIKAADWVIVAIRRLSEGAGSAFAISAVILAIGTSLPELFLGVTSALEGSPNITLGVVLGSNIANVSLMTGLAALIAGTVHVKGGFIKRDIWIALGAGIMPILLVIDGELTRVDGFILLAAYGAYASSFFRMRFLRIAKEQRKEGVVYRFLQRFYNVGAARRGELGRLFVGIALLLFSADMIVRISEALAVEAGVPIFVIGLVLLAAGTSLPELAFSIRSLGRKNSSMFFGNILGSTIANSTLVLGVVAVIHPIKIFAANQYLVAVAAFVIIFLTFWYFIKSKRRLERWEAGVLLLLYFIFVVMEFV